MNKEKINSNRQLSVLPAIERESLMQADLRSWASPTQGRTCAAIGPRCTYHCAAGSYAPGMLAAAPLLDHCSHVGESRAATKCCRWSGYNCYEKNASRANCLMDCYPGKANGGIANQPIVQPGSPEDNSLLN